MKLIFLKRMIFIVFILNYSCFANDFKSIESNHTDGVQNIFSKQGLKNIGLKIAESNLSQESKITEITRSGDKNHTQDSEDSKNSKDSKAPRVPLESISSQDFKNLEVSKGLADSQPTKDSKHTESALPLKDYEVRDYEIGMWRYIAVILVMVAILVLLYIIRQRQNKGIVISSITLEQAKILDSKNKIAIIKYKNNRYIIGLNPNGITLIDKIDSNDSKDLFSQEESHSFSSKLTQQFTKDDKTSKSMGQKQS